ncbi:response regulator [Bacillus sp. FJAT-50079]|uniref:response regulator transcription factor n=1 Tax=Bacillus sp. FJAT-50079 TaxID=2833577 RepID=UPI001BC95A08|nr:response regulator [Bacillus sp. FJAT-50079]MBS4210632.1 response regulator [Bacillus sp. FJAT-50079]
MHQILLVEDERWVRTAIRKTVEKTGLPFTVVHESKNGVDAYDWLTQNNVDIVLTDIRMPAMDGIALMGEVRRLELKTDVVIISGHDDFAYTQQAIRLGAFDYLLKPVELDGLNETLKKWMAQKERIQEENQTMNVDELSPIEQVIQYMKTSISADFSLATAANMAHLSPSYFCKLFKKQTGTNFSDYVISIRMEEASRLLVHTSLRISEIADRLGYADLAYFSNSFKKVMGVTPSQYRKNDYNEEIG